MPIRLMNSADIPAVLRIQGELAFQDWNERQYELEIKAPYTYAIVYENEGEIIGYAVFHLLGADSELLSIAVRETAQKSGIGGVAFWKSAKTTSRPVAFTKSMVLLYSEPARNTTPTAKTRHSTAPKKEVT